MRQTKITIKGETYKVGDGATIVMYSDRHACTIIDIAKNGSTITVQQDKATRIDHNGMSDCQEYEYERDLNGEITIFKRTRKYKDCYTDNGRVNDYGCLLGLGYRREYYDFSF